MRLIVLGSATQGSGIIWRAWATVRRSRAARSVAAHYYDNISTGRPAELHTRNLSRQPVDFRY